MKNKTIFVFVGVVISLSAIVFGVVKYNSLANACIFSKDITGIGKSLTFEVNREDVRNFSFIENNEILELWDKNEKEKFIEYMKEKKATIAVGKYTIYQGTKFEKSIEIIKFDKE